MRKIKLLELDITVIRETFIAYSAGIWYKKLSVPEYTQNLSPIVTIFSGTWEDLDNVPISLGSVRVNNALLGSVDSIAELQDQDGSFYYNYSSQTLYLALFDYYPAKLYNTYKVGEVTGFIDKAQMQYINGEYFPTDSYLGATYYDPRLVDDIDIEESIDDQQNGIFIFDDITASIRNSDGRYDNIRDNVTGNEARVLLARISESPEEEIATGIEYKQKADATDFEVIREGVIDDIDYSDPNEPVVTAIDRRSDWTQKISENLMSVADYPDIESTYQDKRKPLLIGQVNGAKCIRLEPEPSSSSAIDFLICDTSIGDIETVDDIYFDGKISGSEVDRYLTTGEYSVDMATGILTVNNYDSGSVYFYGQVTEMTETVEIILFLLTEYANLSYIDSNFNKEEIEIIRDLNYKTHVYIDTSGEELYSVIEKLVMDIHVDFFQQGVALTMRLGNEARASTESIPRAQLFDNPAPWVNDRIDTVKTISVEYNIDYRLDTSDTYYDDSRESEAVENNRKAVDKTFESNLINIDDIIEIYESYYSRFTAPSRTVTINRAYPFEAGLTDFVTFKLVRTIDGEEVTVFENALYKIISYDAVNNTAELAYFSDAPETTTVGGANYGIENYGVVNYGQG